MGSIRGPGRGVAWGRNRSHVHWNFCSLETVLEEPSWRSEGRVGVGTSRVQGPRRWRKPRIAGEKVVTAEIEGIVPVLDLEGTSRSCREMPKVPEKAEIQGWSRRKPPRRESVRLRNSSGSVTA